MARERKEISNEYKWDLDKMYPNREAMEADIAYIEGGLKEVASYKGKLSDSADSLYKALKLMEDISRKISHYYVYTHMRHHEDTRINENLADSSKSEMISTDLSKATAYISLWMKGF